MGLRTEAGRLLSLVGDYLSGEREATFRPLIQRHMGQDPARLPIVGDQF
jgi:hypothetical protein